METIFDRVLSVVLDAVVDTLWLIPFLFLTYLLMEWIENRASSATESAVRRAGSAGPLVGALLGVVPQCGFSAAAATLWAGRVVTIGTLFAVFLATSDEMLPIFIAEQVPVTVILKILGTKVLIGMVMGFIVDAILRVARHLYTPLHIHELCEYDHCHCDDEKGGILMSAVKHTAQVTLFVFIITLVLNALLEIVGEEALAAFLSSNEALSVLASGLVGLVPNCAASLIIAELYVSGILSSGAMIAGLLSAAGVGLLVLLRTNHSARQNIAIIVLLYAMAVLWGFAVDGLGIVF